jgi:serine/threonine-protein kinase
VRAIGVTPVILSPGTRIGFSAAPELTVLEHVYGAPQTGRAVYKVQDSRVGLTYALKVIELGQGQDVRSVEREINALNRQAAIGQYFPRVRAFEQAGSCAYLLMDWMEGVTLDRFTGSTGVVAGSELGSRLRVISGLCVAIAALHARHIIHRDLKPQNVVVRDRRDPSRSVAVLDLGLSAQKRGDAEGSEGYAAPEQSGFRNFSLSPRTDVFAIGQLLAFVATGAALPLRPGPDLRDWAVPASALLAAQHPSPLPAQLVNCIGDCTHLLPDRRPASVQAVRHALNSLQKVH